MSGDASWDTCSLLIRLLTIYSLFTAQMFIFTKGGELVQAESSSRKKRKRGLTALLGHASGDVDEDAGVADDHDEQRQQEEAAEGEHVVGGFLPVMLEAASGGALSEVGWVGDAHVVEN